jgi:hypothetical protein
MLSAVQIQYLLFEDLVKEGRREKKDGRPAGRPPIKIGFS